MELKTCRKCGEPKPRSEFYKGQGKCIPCFREHQRQSRGVKKRRAAPSVGAATGSGEPEASGRLSRAPSLGMEAYLENGLLQLVQGDDVVALSPDDLRAIQQHFAEWIATGA